MQSSELRMEVAQCFTDLTVECVSMSFGCNKFTHASVAMVPVAACANAYVAIYCAYSRNILEIYTGWFGDSRTQFDCRHRFPSVSS